MTTVNAATSSRVGWFARLLGVMGCIAVAQSGAQEPGPGGKDAQLMPLAAESLLLDITRVGDVFVAVGERGHIVTSTDGNTWAQADVVPTRSTLTSVTANGERLWAAGHDSVIVVSDDGGRNWAIQYQDIERQQPIMDILFQDGDNGFAIGAYGLMLVTGDGGETWEERFPSPDEWHLNDLMDLGGGDMLIAAEAGVSYLSKDNGETWEEIPMPYPGSMFGLVAGGGDCVLTIGLRGNGLESCDAGSNWSELPSPTESSLSAGVNHDGVTLIVGNSGALLQRGESGGFTVTYHSAGTDFSSVLALEDGRYLIVGEEGIHHWPERAPEPESGTVESGP